MKVWWNDFLFGLSLKNIPGETLRNCVLVGSWRLSWAVTRTLPEVDDAPTGWVSVNWGSLSVASHLTQGKPLPLGLGGALPGGWQFCLHWINLSCPFFSNTPHLFKQLTVVGLRVATDLSLCSPSHSGRGGASRLYLSVHRSVCLGLVELIREEPVLVFLASSALLSTSGGFVGNRIMRDQTTSSTPTVRPWVAFLWRLSFWTNSMIYSENIKASNSSHHCFSRSLLLTSVTEISNVDANF